MKPSLAIETFVLGDLNSSDILLRGIDGIDKASYQLSTAHYYKQISSDNSVSNVMGLGPDNKFFYKLTSYKDNAVTSYEYGIGYAYQLNNNTYFKREKPLVYGKNENHRQLIQDRSLRFYCEEGSTNVITSELPHNIAALYFDKNSILVSRDSFTPHPVKILDNSFLARLDDNDVASLSFDSKEFSDIISEALSNYTKQLSLKTSKLNASKLAVKQLQLESGSQSGAKKGTLIYDEENDVVKFYNGSKWRILQWVDEENQE